VIIYIKAAVSGRSRPQQGAIKAGRIKKGFAEVPGKYI
jgi:hypothetical protein